MTKGVLTNKLSTVVGIFRSLQKITVEPAAFLIMTCALVNYLLSQDLILDRACRINLKFPSEVCDAIQTRNSSFDVSKEEIEVQVVASTVRTYKSIIDHGIPVVIVLFLGPWSDRYGRKLPLLLPCIGYTIQSAVFALFTWLDNVDAYTIGLVTSAACNLCGGLTTFSMSASSYLVDKTSNEERTVRIGILNGITNIGVPAGFAIGGALSTSHLGKIASFGISTGIGAIAFFIVLFAVQNQSNKSENVPDSLRLAKNNTIQVFRLPFVKRDGNQRMQILILLLAYICITAPFHGEFGVMYLFLRKQLGWDAGNYGIFSTYNFVIGVVGTMLSMGILSHWLKLRDPLVGFLAGISQFSACFIYAFATTSFMIYLAPTVDMMNGTMTVVVKSMLSKLVNGDENGKLFSFVGLLDSFIPLAMDPTYSTLYRLTINSFAGSFFFLSAFVTIPPQIIFLFFIVRKWAGSAEKKDSKNHSENIPPESCQKPKLHESVVSLSTSTTTVDTHYTDC